MLLNVQWQIFMHIQDERIFKNDDESAFCKADTLSRIFYVLAHESNMVKSYRFLLKVISEAIFLVHCRINNLVLADLREKNGLRVLFPLPEKRI